MRSDLNFIPRPETFDQIVGQDHAVRMLRNLLRPRQVGLNILFHGAIGSGKTSMARIYAKALNCLDLREDGSPCSICANCKDNQGNGLGFTEIDVPGEKNRVPDVVELVRAQATTPLRQGTGYRILFLDEAHCFSAKEFDALLKIVEEPSERVVFLFATTEFHNIRRTMRSRLFPIEVRPLPQAIAIQFLRDAAAVLDMNCEPEALALLAGLKDGYPRDLIKGLEQLKVFGGPYTAERVRELFDVDHVAMLVSYFVALAESDVAGQSRFLNDWHETIADKVRWVQAMLLKIYYGEVQNRHFIGDPVVESIPAAELKEIVDGFAARLDVEGSALKPIWLRMLNFWSPSHADNDRTSLFLRFALFHELVNDGLTRQAPPELVAQSSRRTVARPAPAAVEASTGFLPAKPLPDSALAGRPPHHDAPNFLTADDARTVVNTASFFTQHHGLLFNAYFELRPDRFGSETEDEHRKVAAAFLDELENLVTGTKLDFGQFAGWLTSEVTKRV